MTPPLTQSQSGCIDHLAKWRVGAIFMEAGTGKTRVACNILSSTDTDRVLWIGPLCTLGSGSDSVPAEINKWGMCKPIRYVGVESLSQSDRIYLEVTEWLQACDKATIVVDESLKIKNYHAKRTRRVLELGKKASYRYILNGTPLSRNLLDLWSQMQFLSPKILNMTYGQFLNTFCDYTVYRRRYGRFSNDEIRINGIVNIDYLYSLISPYVFRADLHLNLTQNYHDITWFPTEETVEEYTEIKNHFLDIEELAAWNNNIFMAMTTKMQLCYALDAKKLRTMDKLMSELDHDKTIIFCRFIASAEECARRYPKALTLTYGKGALGLNLQERCITVYFDKIWDYALREQSGRRTYRTGQIEDCQYYDLTGWLGLEDMIDRNIERKVSLTEYFKLKTKEEIYKEL